MNPSKVTRDNLCKLTDLPNIGPSIAGDLQQIGIMKPIDLIGRDPIAMYDELCAVTQVRHDLCILDVFLSITRFMAGEEPAPWWNFTDERKESIANRK